MLALQNKNLTKFSNILVNIFQIIPFSMIHFQTQRGRIPVVVLDDIETKRLKKQLNEATFSGSIIRIAFEYVDFEPQYTLRLQVN